MIRNVELNAKVNGLIDECRELRRSQLLEEEFLIEKKPRKERRRKLVAHTWREDDASLRDDDRTVDTTGELIWNNQSAPP